MVNTPGELTDQQIGELWRHYRFREGEDESAELVLRLISKLICELAWSIPYGSGEDRLRNALKQFGLTLAEWKSAKCLG